MLEYITPLLSGADSDVLKAAILAYFDLNTVLVDVIAWEHSKNFLVLKVNIWSDKKPTIATSITLENIIENTITYISPVNTTDINGFPSNLFRDASSLEVRLRDIPKYSEASFGVSPNSSVELSLPFRIEASVPRSSLLLRVHSGSQSFSFKIEDLISEKPTIQDYVKFRWGNDIIEKTIENLGGL